MFRSGSWFISHVYMLVIICLRVTTFLLPYFGPKTLFVLLTIFSFFSYFLLRFISSFFLKKTIPGFYLLLKLWSPTYNILTKSIYIYITATFPFCQGITRHPFLIVRSWDGHAFVLWCGPRARISAVHHNKLLLFLLIAFACFHVFFTPRGNALK
jgi:hypothetical protein